jgi:hypothetical protein
MTETPPRTSDPAGRTRAIREAIGALQDLVRGIDQVATMATSDAARAGVPPEAPRVCGWLRRAAEYRRARRALDELKRLVREPADEGPPVPFV